MYNYFFNKDNKNSKATWLVWALIGFLGFWFKLSCHEFWRDEWQAWLVARDMSWSEMFGFLYYEGHPSLWYIYLKIWTNVPNILEDIVLKSAHGLLWLGALWILFFRSRMALSFAVVLSLSYFVLFEYGVVVRGYALVLGLSLLAASFFQKKEGENAYVEKPLGLALILFLLCQTEAQGVLIAGCLSLYFLLNVGKNAFRSPVLWGAMAGVVAFITTVFPRGQAEELASARNSSLEIAAAFQGLFSNTFLPGILPDTRVGGVSVLGMIASVLVLAALFYLFFEQKKILKTFGFGALLFLGFASILFLGGIRQWGNFFILFLVLLQFLALEKTDLKPIQATILGIFALANLQYGLRALQKDFSLPFSNAKETAAFLEKQVPENIPILAVDPFKTAPVGAYLDRPLYKLPEGETFTYFHWLRKVYIAPEAEMLLFADFKKQGGVLVLSPAPLPAERYPKAQLWKKFDGNDLKGERFWIYRIKK